MCILACTVRSKYVERLALEASIFHNKSENQTRIDKDNSDGLPKYSPGLDPFLNFPIEF